MLSKNKELGHRVPVFPCSSCMLALILQTQKSVKDVISIPDSFPRCGDTDRRTDKSTAPLLVQVTSEYCFEACVSLWDRQTCVAANSSGFFGYILRETPYLLSEVQMNRRRGKENVFERGGLSPEAGRWKSPEGKHNSLYFTSLFPFFHSSANVYFRHE